MAQEGVAAAAEAGTGAKAAAVACFSFKPQLVVPSARASEAVEFYKAAFGAEELKRVNHPKRKAEQDVPLVVCAELKIGASILLVCDQIDDSAAEGKTAADLDSGIIFRLETNDVHAAVAKAVDAGAVAEGEITEEEGPCGGLVGKVKDPLGHVWAVYFAKKCCDVKE